VQYHLDVQKFAPDAQACGATSGERALARSCLLESARLQVSAPELVESADVAVNGEDLGLGGAVGSGRSPGQRSKTRPIPPDTSAMTAVRAVNVSAFENRRRDRVGSCAFPSSDPVERWVAVTGVWARCSRWSETDPSGYGRRATRG
jgi:hypothetical protein